jgi:hypothetical protein
MAETILSSPFFIEMVLPFILVFTIVFAILQKTEVLGKGKKQIDAIVSLVTGLIVVSFGWATGFITKLMPILAVALVVILVFMILFGSLFKSGDFAVQKGLKIAIGIIIGVALIVGVIYAAGAWDFMINLFSGEAGPGLISNIVFIALIIGAIAVVIGFGKAGESSGSGKKD